MNRNLSKFVKDNYWIVNTVYRKCPRCSFILQLNLSMYNVPETVITQIISKAHIQNNYQFYSSYFVELEKIIDVEIANNKFCLYLSHKN